MKNRKFYLLSAALLLTGLFRFGVANAGNLEEVRRDFAVKDVTVNEMVSKLGSVYPYTFIVAEKEAADVIKVSVDVKNATATEVLVKALSEKGLSFDKTVTIKVSTNDCDHSVVAVATQGGSRVQVVTTSKKQGKKEIASADSEPVCDDKLIIRCNSDSDSPLVLIDNVEVTPSDLAKLQPSDIESFSILKDASATALYGDRGAKGVILVTSKAGRKSNKDADGEPECDKIAPIIRSIGPKDMVDPLILIDNVEATSSDLAKLQPSDIESFSILKDASATVSYGARGANGVVLVTSKASRKSKEQ
jgi:TonB-dependent SusC/RagA subfamily outer membrane receptor